MDTALLAAVEDSIAAGYDNPALDPRILACLRDIATALVAQVGADYGHPITLCAPNASQPLPIRDWTTSELLRESELMRWHLAEAETMGRQEGEIAHRLHDGEAKAIGNEVRRREQAKRAPSAPPWPSAPADKSAMWAAIKERTPILGLVNDIYPHEPTQKGQAWWVPCLLTGHQDKTPSLAIYPDGHFHCYSCEASGDVFDFVRLYMGLSSFAAAVEVLGQRCGVTDRAIALPNGVVTALAS